jgi:hypothetical protein
MASFRLIPLLSLLTLLLVTSSVFGQASDLSKENQKQNTASERPAATESSGFDPRITTTRLSIRDRLKARANTQKTQLEINQALVGDMKKEWVGMVFPREMPAFERQMSALLRAYQTGDEAAWKKLTAETRYKARDFNSERAGFAGRPMHFISGIDGFETNAGVQIRCFFPIDKDGNRVGTELHFIVTGLSELNGENVTAIVHSGTGDLPTENDVKGAMAYLAKKYSLPTKEPSGTSPDSDSGKAIASKDDIVLGQHQTSGKLTVGKRPKSKASAQQALLEVNQALIDDVIEKWGHIVGPSKRPAYEAQVQRLTDAYQRNDEDAWRKLHKNTGTKGRTFSAEQAAFAGGPMHFISEVDGIETNAGSRIRCFFPIDKAGDRVGTNLHYVVSGSSSLNGENVLGIHESGSGDLPTEEDVKGAMLYLAKKYSLPPESKGKSD